MKKTFVFIGLALLIVGVSSSAFAGVQKGDREMSINGNLTNSESFDASGNSYEDTNFMLGGTFGCFLSDASEIGVSSIGVVSSGDSSDFALITTNGFYKHHFNTEGDFVPYIGLQAGISHAEAGNYSSDSASFGGMIGVKQFLTETTSAYLEYNVNVTKFDYDGTKIDSTQKALLFGLAYYF